VFEDDYGRDGFINNYTNKIKETFELSPSYFSINKIINGIAEYNTFYDSWLMDEDEYKDDIPKKKIIMKPGQDLQRGEIINVPKWNNQKWLVTRVDPENLYYNNGLVE
jgi:hypothetical protein